MSYGFMALGDTPVLVLGLLSDEFNWVRNDKRHKKRTTIITTTRTSTTTEKTAAYSGRLKTVRKYVRKLHGYIP